jgi:hypothetical protein
MVRAISVVLAVLALLGVGWFFGHRPIPALEARFARDAAAWGERETELVQKANDAEARGMLRVAEAELLLAAGDAEARNFGIAGSRARRAHDLIIRAAAIPGVVLELGPIRGQVESANNRLEALDRRSPALLRFAAEELRRVLERSGRA